MPRSIYSNNKEENHFLFRQGVSAVGIVEAPN